MANGQEIQLGGLFSVQGWQPNIECKWREVRGWPRRGPTAGGWLKAILHRRDGGRIPTWTPSEPRKRSAEIHACDTAPCRASVSSSIHASYQFIRNLDGEKPTSEGAWQGRNLWSTEKPWILISGRV